MGNFERLKELGKEDIFLRYDATSIERFGHKMMLDSLAGVSDEIISLRYGVTPDVVQDLISVAVEDCLAIKRHREVQANLIVQLRDRNIELEQINEQLPLNGERTFQALDAQGNVTNLKEEISNVEAKLNIISERKQNMLAIGVLLGVDTGELSPEDRQRDMAKILSAISPKSQD